jgi:hypothetical protein
MGKTRELREDFPEADKAAKRLPEFSNELRTPSPLLPVVSWVQGKAIATICPSGWIKGTKGQEKLVR